MQNNFTEPRKLFFQIWGDQCIIFRDQGSTDPPGGLNNARLRLIKVLISFDSESILNIFDR